MSASLTIALCQIDTTIGAFEANVAKACESLARAAEKKAGIAVFPELCLSSYPPLDLLDRPEFLEKNEKALNDLVDRVSRIANAPQIVVVGSITRAGGGVGRTIQNSAVVLRRDRAGGYGIAHVQPKRLLPTYDVFDESRYFEPGTESKLLRTPFGLLGFSVCEDAWFEETRLGRRLYANDPAEGLKGADLVINISASPFELNKRARRREMLGGFVKRIGAPLVYVNQVGANDEILFDGSSQVFSAAGEVRFEAAAFEEGTFFVELETTIVGAGAAAARPLAEAELLRRGLVAGIRNYFGKTGFSKAVIGLSGGIDSAVTACLAVEALGSENVLGVSMPGRYSSSHSLTDAEALARSLGIEYRVHSIKFVFSTLLMELKASFAGAAPDVTEENIQARLRAVMLLALANKRGALVLTTGNKSELAVGYCTTYGDMAGALAPLGDVYKTRVYELARHINAVRPVIPESTVTKPPSAELRPGQTDEQSLGPYSELDPLLEAHIEGLMGEDQLVREGFRPADVKTVVKLVRASEFKRRQAAPVIKVTSKAFGLGRRMPIAKGF
ncbi:MAG: NAD+ synthase [Deltaproteobacteria bacterium]|nr:NAD+ synthase [Deltaproteobacteria bacterium]